MTIEMLYNLLPILIIAFGLVLSLLLIAWQRSQNLILFFSLFVFASALFACFSLPVHFNYSVQITPLLKVDGFGNFAVMLILISAMAVSVLASKWLTNSVEVHDEFYLLLQLVVLGASILVMSDHFAALFLGFELLSIALVGLVGYGKDSQFSVETSFKYLILSASASSFMLLGIAFIYSQTGSLGFSGTNVSVDSGLFHQMGILLFLVGVSFKLSLAPFHFWTPDVYQGSPLPVTLLLASISKVAMFVVLMKCWFSQAYQYGPNTNANLTLIITVLAIASMLLGNTLALKQKNIKRLLAYSSIAHMGYLLIVLLIISPQSLELAWKGALFYLAAYVLATVSIFTALALSQAKHENVMAKVADWQGLFWQQPWLALLIIVSILSLAGIPLTMGFIGKFYLLNIAVQAQQWALIVGLIIGSGIGLFYYLGIVFTLFVMPKEQQQVAFVPALKALPKITVIALIFLSLFLGLFPDHLSQLFIVKW